MTILSSLNLQALFVTAEDDFFFFFTEKTRIEPISGFLENYMMDTDEV